MEEYSVDGEVVIPPRNNHRLAERQLKIKPDIPKASLASHTDGPCGSIVLQ